MPSSIAWKMPSSSPQHHIHVNQRYMSSTNDTSCKTNTNDGDNNNDESNLDDDTTTMEATTTTPTSTVGDDGDRVALPGFPGSQTGGKKLAIVFTCGVCGTRAAKQFTERAYTHGVVLVKCPGCGNQHLIADNLSMFTDDTENEDGSGWNIQKAVAKIGQNVTTVTDGNVLELTLEGVVGSEKWNEIHQNHNQNEDDKGDDEK